MKVRNRTAAFLLALLFLLRIGGAEDMETLEHIARELEIDVTDELHEHDPDFNIGIMNIGRG